VYSDDHRGHGRAVLPAKNFGDFGHGGFTCSSRTWGS
jgi:hypothetical protein